MSRIAQKDHFFVLGVAFPRSMGALVGGKSGRLVLDLSDLGLLLIERVALHGVAPRVILEVLPKGKCLLVRSITHRIGFPLD